MEFERLSAQASDLLRARSESGPELAATRRILQDRRRSLAELDALFLDLCRVNQETNDRGQAHIDVLEKQVRQLQSEVQRLRQARGSEQGLWAKTWSRLIAFRRN